MKKVIVITGGSDGLGKTIAQDLSKDSIVIILSKTKEKLESVSKELNVDFFECDIADPFNVSKAIAYILNKYSTIDVLINNAGLWIQEELDFNNIDRVKEVLDVNLFGLINMTKAVIPIMKKNQDGLIININSQAGINFKAERTIYNASKWGVTGFTKSLQPELSKYGIRVTDIMSGMMKTNMFKKMGIDKNMDNSLDTKEVARVIRFILETPKDVLIPEVGIKNINN